MSKYLHSIINGRRTDSIYPTEDAANNALNAAIDKHEARNERGRMYNYGPSIRVVFEIWDRDGITFGKYWLSDDEHSPEPDERDGPRVKI